MSGGTGGFSAVILAAGASSRMGEPKALLRFGHETFLDRLVRVFGAHCAPVAAVLGHGAEAVARGLEFPEAALLALNPRPERGQFSSLQTGLRAAIRPNHAVFFHPVDVPGIRLGTVARLCAAWAQAPPGTQGLKPVYRGKSGHPVLLGAPLAAELLTLPAETVARDALARHAAAIALVEVDDAWILRDADTPEEYRALWKGAAPE